MLFIVKETTATISKTDTQIPFKFLNKIQLKHVKLVSLASFILVVIAIFFPIYTIRHYHERTSGGETEILSEEYITTYGYEFAGFIMILLLIANILLLVARAKRASNHWLITLIPIGVYLLDLT